MSSYDHINDEEELHKLMNATDSFEDRKKIRSRLREIRDKQREEMESRRQQREKETEDLVRKKFELAEEEKRRKLQSYGQQAPTHQRQSEYQAASDRLVVDKHRVAEEEKQKKLQAYTTIAKKEHAADLAGGRTTSSTTTTTTQGPDGSTTVTKKTETTTVKQTSGFGGVQYGSPAPKSAAEEADDDENDVQGSASFAERQTATEGAEPERKEPINANTESERTATAYPPNENPAPVSPETENATTELETASADDAANSCDSKLEKIAEVESEQKVDGGKTETGSDDGKVKAAELEAAKTTSVPKPSTAVTKLPDLNTRQLKEQLGVLSGPDSSGSISVRTESWSSHGGPAHKAQKTESWGAKPQGAKGAMAAFKQMDAANPAPKTNGLITVSLAKRAATTMRKNAVAIKEEVLRFVQANLEDYQNVEVTNFSSSWNDGMAFCALIHHFFPDAFDFKQLDPKNRRHNFELAFDTAEKVADIAPLLDVEDMVKMKNPDWKCVFTYVQSIYRHLRDHDKNKAKAGEAEA